MYGDTKSKHDRMKKFKGSASSKNLMGKMSSDKLEQSARKAMTKALTKKKSK